ncbi:MAG: deoxyguanosinetriphosphate triphosphohydrolase [Candidatus Borkfalkiaceae bacterium]|nr:deoxyguanosinetriphosphate triphosphohydrolase [Christensenellaceae bacterium]
MKEITFRKENEFFSPYAAFSEKTKGRAREEEACPMRTEYQRDRDRIIYSKAFRRLKNKTQVFFSPEGDHYMTRLTHTLDVAQVARSICRVLDLNEDLAEAIALGHDLGHTPFGHTGERILNRLNPKGFRHNEQSLRVVDVLENDGAGLNLTYEVRDGIVEHKKSGNPHTLEGKVVSLSDRIAYLNHDIDDAVRAGIFTEKDLPREAVEILGGTSRERINNMIFSILRHSGGKDDVGMEEEYRAATECLRKFLFDRVYDDLAAKKEEARAGEMISAMYCHYKSNVDALPGFYRSLLDRYDADTVVSDYISSMTDRYAVYSFEEIYVPKNFLLK